MHPIYRQSTSPELVPTHNKSIMYANKPAAMRCARGCKKKSGEDHEKSLDYQNISKVWAKKRSTQSGRPLKGRFDVETNETMPYLSVRQVVVSSGEILRYE